MKEHIEKIVCWLPFCAFLFGIPSASLAAVPVEGEASVEETGGALILDEYGSWVEVDGETGNISGYIWSEDVGWIDLDDNGGGDSVRIDMDSGEVLGQAYVFNTESHIDFASNNSNTQVDLSGGGITGYVWSPDVGWINFSSARVSGGLLPLEDTGQNVLLVLGLLGLGMVMLKKRLLMKEG